MRFDCGQRAAITGDLVLIMGALSEPLSCERALKQAVQAEAAVSSSETAQSALAAVEALLAKDRAPFSGHLHWLRARLLLRLHR
jgi:hypothetical protein